MRRIEHEKAVALAKAEKAKKEAAGVGGARSTRSPITLSLKAGEDGRLFGSVTAKDIENAVKARQGRVTVDRKKMQLAEAIKHDGLVRHPGEARSDVTATLKVEVVAK